MAWVLGCLGILLLGCLNCSSADIYPLSRRSGLPSSLWTSAGVADAWPRVSTVYTNLSPGVSGTQINAAIAACPSNEIVHLNAGTYNLSATINLTKNGVVLRGATNASGFPTTILSNVLLRTSSFYYPSGGNGGWGATNISVRTITNSITEGSSNLICSAALNNDFLIGDVIMLDQLDEGINVFNDTQDDTFVRNNRSYGQAVRIVATNVNVITIDPPLVGTYWDTNRTIHAVGWSTSLGRTAQRIGVENLKIVEGSQGDYYTLRMGPIYGSWVRNVNMIADNAAAIRLSYAVHCEVMHSVFRDSTGDGSGTYAVLPAVVSFCRVEDNIFTNLSLAIPCHSAVGCSFSYNYGTGPYPYSTAYWFAEYMFPHGGHTHHTLWEGNWLDGPIEFDDVFFNNNSDNGIVRNRLLGWATGKTLNTKTIVIGEIPGSGGVGNHRNTTIIGNLLGANNYHTLYSQLVGIQPECTGTIRTNNFNTVNDAVNPAETMAGGQTILDSYTYAIKPAWFGDRPWPPFQVTSPGSGTNTQSYTNIPAGYRSAFNADPVPDVTAPVISNVVVSDVTINSARISWETDEPTIDKLRAVYPYTGDGQIIFIDIAESYNAGPTNSHHVLFEHLYSSATYGAIIYSTNAVSLYTRFPATSATNFTTQPETAQVTAPINLQIR